MVNILQEQPLTLVEAVKVLPGRPHVNTLRRWAFSGLNGVKLRHFKCGGRVCTTIRAIEEFLTEINPDYRRDEKPVASSAHELAEQQLDSMGV